MDNLAHTLVGVALSRTGLGSKVPFGTTSLVIAANLPDADCVMGWWGPLYYLQYHRGLTHSVLGVLVLALLLSLILKFLKRFLSPKESFPFESILLAVTITLASHSLLDLTNSYGLRPWLPFSEKWYYGDLVFIVDPYIWLILGGSIFLTSRRTTVTRPVWIAVIIFICYLLVRNATTRPEGLVVAVIWFLSMSAIMVLKKRRLLWSHSLNTWALCGIALYWALLFVTRNLTLQKAIPSISREHPQVQVENLSILPQLSNPLGWNIFWQEKDRTYTWKTNLFNCEPREEQIFNRYMDHRAVQAALGTCLGHVFETFGRFTFYEVTQEQDQVLVVARDARFASTQTSGFGVVHIPLSKDLFRSLSTLACPCLVRDPFPP